MIRAARRPLAVLLAVLLVPILVITSGSGAQAATTTFGPAAQADLSVNTNKASAVAGESASCNVVGYWMADGDTMDVKGTVSCSSGYDWATLFVDLEFKGDGCDSGRIHLGTDLDGGGTTDFLAPMGSVAGSCAVDTVCGWLDGDAHVPFTRHDNLSAGCEPITIGGPNSTQTPDAGCDYGDVKQPTESGPVNVASPGGSYGYARDVTFTVNDGTDPWVLYVIVKRSDGTTTWYPDYSNTAAGASTLMPNTGETAYGMPGPGSQTIRVYTSGVNSADYSPKPEPGDRIVGAGYYRWAGMVAGFKGGSNANYLQSYDSSQWSWTASTGLIGITNPSECAFYWGQKVVSRTDSDTGADDGDSLGSVFHSDDPTTGGTTDEPPATATPPTDGADSCSFSFTDPTTWAGGGICELVQLMSALIDAIGHILDGLTGILQAAFVPNPDSWGFSGLVDQFQSRPPGSLFTGAADGVKGATDSFNGSGCGTIADFTSSDTHGSARITCSQIKSVPGFSGLYDLVEVALWALTGLAVWRMLAAGITRGEG